MQDKFKTIIKILFVFGLLLLGYSILASQYNLNLFERMQSLEEDGGSGRDVIYSEIWESYKESDFIKQIYSKKCKVFSNLEEKLVCLGINVKYYEK